MADHRVTAAMCAYGRALGEPRLSPDAGRVAFVSTAGGRASLVVVPVSGGPELTATTEPAPPSAASYGGGVFDWTPDGESLVYVGSDGGLWLAPATGGPPREIAEPHPTGSAGAPAVSPDGRRVAYVIDQRHVAVASLEPDGGWPVRISATADFCFDPAWSPDGRRLAWHEWDVPAMAWDASRIMTADVADVAAAAPPTAVAGGVEPDGRSVSTGQPRFAQSGNRLAFLSDEGGWLNLWAADSDGDPKPLLSEEIEHGFPTWGLGQRSYAWSPEGDRVAFTRNDGGFVRLAVLDVATGSARDIADGFHAALSWSGDRLAAIYSDSATPTQIVVYDVSSATRETLAIGPVAGFEGLDLPEPKAVHWPAEDGSTVHGRLYLPVASATGTDPPPMLVWIHGGPTSQWPVSFIARFAFFLDRGWAILVPDHRGSTGYGRAYTQAMAGGWGVVDVDDTAAGMRAAAERGWGDERRMVPLGGSAGGFTVLNLLAHHPQLCAAGVDLFGVADLFELDETTHRFEKHYLHTVVGPLPEAADRYRERSPVNVADTIEAPLLILQGDADKVVPPAQSEAVAAKLQARGRIVDLHLYEGEGHGWNRPETVIDELGRIEDFLRRHVLRWRA